MRYVPYREVGARPNIVVDGAPLASTTLTLSHWPNNTSPAAFRRETSTETALAWVESHDPRRVAGIVTNNHFDEDGPFSMYTVLEPRRALAAVARSYRHVDSILKRGLDRLTPAEPNEVPRTVHENIRGPGYYH